MKAGLARIIAQGFDHNTVVLFQQIRKGCLFAIERDPAVVSHLEIDLRQHAVHEGQLHRQPAAPVQHK